MAYTNTPMQSVEQTSTLPFLTQWQTRDISGTKDTETVNLVWDVVNDPSGRYTTAIKREGLEVMALSPPLPSQPTGMFAWNNWLNFFGPFGAVAYDVNTLAQVADDNAVTFYSDRPVGITEYQYESGNSVLIVTDGANIALYDTTGGLTFISDPDRPTNHLPYPVYLDGYLFLATGAGRIQNSDLNDPTSWSSSNVIDVEGYPDGLGAIARHGTYIAALGLSSTQFFYNAANPTGTPLAPYTASMFKIGFRGGLASYGDTLLFTGASDNSNTTVYQLEGFNLTDIGIAPVVRRLDTDIVALPVANPLRAGAILAINGHIVYTWHNLYNGEQVQTSVYGIDLQTKLWTKLTKGSTEEFPVLCFARMANQTTTFTALAFVGDNNVYRFSPTVYQDAGIPFTVRFRTKNVDFETRRVKFGSRLVISADQPPATSLLSIRWTDDDYQTYSASRNVDLFSVYPHLHSLGQFRKRAWEFSYTDNYPLRISSVELDYTQGQA